MPLHMYGTGTAGIFSAWFTGIEQKMVKKNTKTRKKVQKVDQTTSLQKSEDPKFTENPVKDTDHGKY